jgi:hypothetical protein
VERPDEIVVGIVLRVDRGEPFRAAPAAARSTSVSRVAEARAAAKSRFSRSGQCGAFGALAIDHRLVHQFEARPAPGLPWQRAAILRTSVDIAVEQRCIVQHLVCRSRGCPGRDGVQIDDHLQPAALISRAESRTEA